MSETIDYDAVLKKFLATCKHKKFSSPDKSVTWDLGKCPHGRYFVLPGKWIVQGDQLPKSVTLTAGETLVLLADSPYLEGRCDHCIFTLNVWMGGEQDDPEVPDVPG